MCPRVISRFYWILLQLSYFSEDFPDTDFVLQVTDIDLSWRYEDIVVWQTYETLSDGFLDVYVIHRHAVKRAHSPSLGSYWSAGHMLPPHWLLRSPLEICGITELVCLARRSPGTIMGISLAGSRANGAVSEDLWSWYKLSSDAWSNYQWSCALAPCRYFQKAILTLLFSLSGEFIHLVLLLATWRPFLLNQRKREFGPVCSSHLQCSNYAVMRHLQLCKNVFIFISFCLMPISRSLSIAMTKW